MLRSQRRNQHRLDVLGAEEDEPTKVVAEAEVEERRSWDRREEGLNGRSCNIHEQSRNSLFGMLLFIGNGINLEITCLALI